MNVFTPKVQKKIKKKTKTKAGRKKAKAKKIHELVTTNQEATTSKKDKETCAKTGTGSDPNQAPTLEMFEQAAPETQAFEDLQDSQDPYSHEGEEEVSAETFPAPGESTKTKTSHLKEEGSQEFAEEEEWTDDELVTPRPEDSNPHPEAPQPEKGPSEPLKRGLAFRESPGSGDAKSTEPTAKVQKVEPVEVATDAPPDTSKPPATLEKKTTADLTAMAMGSQQARSPGPEVIESDQEDQASKERATSRGAMQDRTILFMLV